MPGIDTNLPVFREALLSNQPIGIDKKGGWYKANIVDQALSYLTYSALCCRANPRDLKVIQAFSKALDRLEKIPVQFHANQPLPDQKVTFDEYVKTSEALKTRYGQDFNLEVRQALRQIDARIVSLKYRCQSSESSVQTSAYPILLSDMIDIVRRWKELPKSETDVFITERRVTAEDKAKLEQLCLKYPDFARTMRTNPILAKDFVKRVIYYNSPLDLYVQFPALHTTLSSSYLITRVGRLPSAEGLKVAIESIKDTNLKEKTVTLKIEGRPESILDPSRVITFKNNHQTTVKKIIDVFAQKKLRLRPV